MASNEYDNTDFFDEDARMARSRQGLSGAGEQVVDLQFAGLRLIQSDKALKFGTDSVLLSSFIRLGARERLVDLGTGTGILPVLLSGRVRAPMVGIELQHEAAELARRNVALNGLSNVRIVEGDLKDARALAGAAEVVCANPPYDRPDAGAMREREAVRLSRYEIACTLEDVVQSAAGLLSTGGRFYMVHRAARLAEILYCLKCHRLEPKAVRAVCKRAEAEPRYVLVQATKDAAAGMRLLPSLVLYRPDGVYTPELRRIYHMEE